jgi:hypothetical protein
MQASRSWMKVAREESFVQSKRLFLQFIDCQSDLQKSLYDQPNCADVFRKLKEKTEQFQETEEKQTLKRIEWLKRGRSSRTKSVPIVTTQKNDTSAQSVTTPKTKAQSASCASRPRASSASTQRGDTTEHKRQRRFVKRGKWKRVQDQKNRQKINLIYNFSSIALTRDMEKVLNRGLNFCVTPPALNLTDILVDYKKFERKMKWKEFFHDQESNEEYIPPIFKKEKTNMPKSSSSELTAFIAGVKGELLGTKANRIHPNISQGEKDALKELIRLQKFRVITIKPADKGAGIVIVNFQDYMASALEHLSSRNLHSDSYYGNVNEQDVKDARAKISLILVEAKENKIISEDEFKAMNPKDKDVGKYYHMYKVHKKHEEGSLPPVRPIISGSGSMTENISHFVDQHAKTLVPKVPSYIQDTPDFLRHLEDYNYTQKLPDNAFPVSIDVTALYSNIDPDEGISVFKKALDTRPNKTVPTTFLVTLLQQVLRLNIFEFDKKLYIQKFGTAMGTRAAPTYANLFMADKDNSIKNVQKTNFPDCALELYFRFIDDIFAIWCGSKESFIQFMEEINKLHPTIKFTSEFNYEERSTAFLDTKITIIDGKLTSDLYKKPTDRAQYLLPSSCHPSHICDNIPYSLALRLIRICSTKKSLDKRLAELKSSVVATKEEA